MMHPSINANYGGAWLRNVLDVAIAMLAEHACKTLRDSWLSWFRR